MFSIYTITNSHFTLYFLLKLVLLFITFLIINWSFSIWCQRKYLKNPYNLTPDMNFYFTYIIFNKFFIDLFTFDFTLIICIPYPCVTEFVIRILLVTSNIFWIFSYLWFAIVVCESFPYIITVSLMEHKMFKFLIRNLTFHYMHFFPFFLLLDLHSQAVDNKSH